jgi:flagellar biosynthesis GTPase FlhF
MFQILGELANVMIHCEDFVSVRDFERITVTVEKIREGWKNLVIEPENKRLLKAMVSDHATTMAMGKKASLARSGSAIDIIRGRGRGRIVFLYGPPGVGKACSPKLQHRSEGSC